MQERITNPGNKKQIPHIYMFTLEFFILKDNEKRDKSLVW